MKKAIQVAALFAIYVAIARASLELSAIHDSASPFWPPAGVAIGGLAILGLRAAPAIFVGAFVANVWVTGHWPSSLGIALGNGGEAMLGAFLIRRGGLSEALSTVGRISIFVSAAAAGALISATVGVGTLVIFGLASSEFALDIWRTWGLANLAGTLVVVPILLTGRPFSWQALTFVSIGMAAGTVAFALPGLWILILLPATILALYTGGNRNGSHLIVGVASAAVFWTAAGYGPFAAAATNEALLLLQFFISAIAIAVLVLGAGGHLESKRQPIARTTGSVALAMAPILAGALFIGLIVHPALAELDDKRSLAVHDRMTDTWTHLLVEPGQQLMSLAAFLENSEVTSAKFSNYVEAAGWHFGAGHLTAIGYSPLVDANDKASFEALVRNDTELPLLVRQNFTIFPPTGFDEHAPVRFVYPLDPRPGAIGFDLFANETRASALRDSATMRSPAASAPVEIVRPDGIDLGLMLAMPVTNDGVVVGYVISALALPNLESAPKAPNGVDYRVVDVTANRELFATGNASWQTSNEISAWGRTWQIQFSTPAQITATEQGLPWFIMLVTGLVAVAMALVFYAYDSSRARAVNLSNEIVDRARSDDKRLAEIRRLEDLDAFRTRFLNIAAHELRTPLSPIRAQAWLLARKGGDDLQKPISILNRGVERLSAVVDDLLTAAKADAGELNLKLEEMDLLEAARDTVSAHEAAAEERGNKLRVDGYSVNVLADRDRLAQILDNLLTNAIKFTKNGTIIVSVTGETRPTLAVIDDGEGIPPDKLKLLGQPFVQAHEQRGGSGLGLHICKTLVQLHKGRLDIQSDGRGKGTKIIIRFPRPDSHSRVEARLLPSQPA